MNKIIYSKIISEQFNINDLDFNEEPDEYDVNIFNKELVDSQSVFSRIYNKLEVSADEIEQLDNYVAAVKMHNNSELSAVIKFYSSAYSTHSLNWLDVSEIVTMSRMFILSTYNGDISKWDVSNVTDMSYMFTYSFFNKNISEWDVSNVTNMSYMFDHSKFNKIISQWDVSHVTDMQNMFSGSSFNHNISKWDVSNVKKHQYMFLNCPIKIKYKPKFRR